MTQKHTYLQFTQTYLFAKLSITCINVMFMCWIPVLTPLTAPRRAGCHHSNHFFRTWVFHEWDSQWGEEEGEEWAVWLMLVTWTLRLMAPPPDALSRCPHMPWKLVCGSILIAGCRCVPVSWWWFCIHTYCVCTVRILWHICKWWWPITSTAFPFPSGQECILASDWTQDWYTLNRLAAYHRSHTSNTQPLTHSSLQAN